MLFISSQNLRKKWKDKKKQTCPAFSSFGLTTLGGLQGGLTLAQGTDIHFIPCVLKTWYKSNKTNGFHGHMMSHDVIWCNSCWLGNAATPLVASTAECERPAATATWAMSHQCHHLSFHPPISKAAPRAKQQSEAKVARSQWVVGASPLRTFTVAPSPGIYPGPIHFGSCTSAGSLEFQPVKRMKVRLKQL